MININKITQFLASNHKKIFALFGCITLAAYLRFRTTYNKKQSNNKLQITLRQLVEEQPDASIIKIVITESENSNGEVRKKILDQLKVIFKKYKIPILVNNSPQKILKAGTEPFKEFVEPNSDKFIDYYAYALKTQLLIEKTILDINDITSQKKQQCVVMMCDNNCMDIKIEAAFEWRWIDFLKKYQIDQKVLMNRYDFILHIISGKDQQHFDKKIQKIWANHKNYFRVDPSEEGQEKAIERSMEKLKIFLNTQYEGFKWQ